MAAGGSGALVVPLPLPFELAPAPLPAKDRWVPRLPRACAVPPPSAAKLRSLCCHPRSPSLLCCAAVTFTDAATTTQTLPRPCRWWWQRQDHIDAELTAKDDAKLGLDCHRLHHSEHGGGQGMRRSLLAGGSWQRDIIAVLQHQAAALRGGPGAPIPRPSAKLVGAARDWKAAAEAAARAAAAEAAGAGHCAYCTHRLSPWERWRCQTCGVGPGGEWFACGGCAQWRGFAAARLDPPTPQLDRSHEDSKVRWNLPLRTHSPAKCWVVACCTSLQTRPEVSTARLDRSAAASPPPLAAAAWRRATASRLWCLPGAG